MSSSDDIIVLACAYTGFHINIRTGRYANAASAPNQSHSILDREQCEILGIPEGTVRVEVGYRPMSARGPEITYTLGGHLRNGACKKVPTAAVRTSIARSRALTAADACALADATA